MNEENLIPMSKRSKAEARELGRKGGKASGESRRRDRDIKKRMELYMGILATDEGKELVKSVLNSDGDIDNLDVFIAYMVSHAQDGNFKYADMVLNDILGIGLRAKEFEEKKRANKAREKIESQKIVGGKTEDITQKAADIFVQLQKHKSDLLDYEEKSGDVNV